MHPLSIQSKVFFSRRWVRTAANTARRPNRWLVDGESLYSNPKQGYLDMPETPESHLEGIQNLQTLYASNPDISM